ncbi:MAG TPA: HEAT repeat domain-containing protein [Acidimicrobiales bacterium]|nr:HEAT repeat domain-containing protein [Acidimicrobiales bacterium]
MDRRHAALAGHRQDESGARAALADADAKVRATALGALERLRALRRDDLETAFGDPAPEVRRRAAELAAAHHDADVLPLLDDPNPLVAEAAAFAAGEHPPRPAAIDALAGAARRHRDPLVREAAVAALGALGDERGLPAILAALDDKPAIRRRAVIALAPFSGPAIDTALRRALTDRDWQVRQAAEDLLAD